MVGYQVLAAGDGREALDLLKSVTPQLIVADVMMPRINGWDLFERIRNDPLLCLIPFVFVTSRTDDESIQKGKGLGAEDYLTKPFKAEELEASIRGKLIRAAQLSRSLKTQAVDTNPKEIRIGDLAIDLNGHRVRRGDEEVSLSPTEFNILVQLGKKAGQTISMHELAEFNFPTSSDDWDAQDTIRVHIKNIRKKIEPDPANPRYIVNIRGVGYRFENLPT
jgi:DNA-binding response OmpR family regulator